MTETTTPAEEGKSRSRVDWQPIALIVALVAVIALAVFELRNRADTGKKLLTSGTYHGVRWGLWAQEKDGSLCMWLDGPGRPADFAGGCTFDNSPGGGYFDSGLGPANSLVSFGPLPSAATSIRVATRKVLVTSPLPGGLPGGRYWIDFSTEQGAYPASWGQPVNPQPLDWQGRAVAFSKF